MSNTPTSASSASGAGGFYDSLAAEYDAMTDYPARQRYARRFVEQLAKRCELRTAIDLATGTGLYAIALAEHGITATGADISAEMLNVARRNAAAAGVNVTWLQAGMEDFSRHLPAPADLLLCLGNSLPHLLTPQNLATAFCEFRNALKPKGMLALQLLNYDKIFRHRERIISIDRNAGTEFIRFYDFPDAGPLLTFNVLTVHWQEEIPRHTLQSTQLRPYLLPELVAALRQAGFAEPELFGGMNFSAYDANTSETVLLLARR